VSRGIVVACAFCGNPVDTGKPGTFLEVSGWTETREGGGAHAITMRRDLGRAAHATCIEVAKRGGEQLRFGGLR